MFVLLRRYLRRVDALYLRCARRVWRSWWCWSPSGRCSSAPNNKASVQLIASFLGIMLAVIFHGGLSCSAARLAAACHGGVGTGAAHPVFAQLPGGGRHHRVRCGRDLHHSWYRVGGMTFQPAELAKDRFI